MNRNILLVNEYNRGYGNIIPLHKLATHPTIKSLGEVRLLLGDTPSEYLGIDCDVMQAPEVEQPIEVKCFEDMIQNTAFGLPMDELLDCITDRMDYLEDHNITHVVLRDSPLMAIAAYALGLPRIFYQNSISIPTSSRLKRNLVQTVEGISESADALLGRVNDVLKSLGKNSIPDVSHVFKSEYNFCSEYPLFDIYKHFNTFVSRGDVKYVGIHNGPSFYKTLALSNMRAVIYLDAPTELIRNLVDQLVNSPYACEVEVFNTHNTKVEPWEQAGVTFIGDEYHPVEPHLVGASIFISNGGINTLLKSISCGCLPLVFKTDEDYRLNILDSMGSIAFGKDAMSIAECFNRPALTKYRKRILSIARIELQSVTDPVTAIQKAIGT